MKIRTILTFVFFAVIAVAAADFQPDVLGRAANGKGVLCRSQGKTVLFVAGTPAEMGAAQGELRKREIAAMHRRLNLVAAGYLLARDDWFFTRIEEVMKRNSPFTPERFLLECDAMAQAAELPERCVREINFFPEIFHCSGAAVRGPAAKNHEVVHVRVLDYMRDIGLQDFAQLTVYLPDGFHAWISHSYPGLVGTVTAMNEKGLAMGEMGGRGEGKWDGLAMAFLMRRIMEECATVDEALALMRSIPLTCDYYYVLSDGAGQLAAVEAVAGRPLKILGPGEQDPQLPEVPPDTVFISAGERAKHLGRRLREQHGRIDAAAMIEIVRRPVAMKSNLHNTVFLPQSGALFVADAGRKTPACDEPYAEFSLPALLDFYRRADETRQPAGRASSSHSAE